MKIYRFLFLLLSGLSSLFACTSFVLDREGSFYLAKNLDWEIDRGYLFYNLDGVEKTSISDTALAWRSRYKSITNNQFGKEFPLGGMNEKGLVIEEMSLFGQACARSTSKQALNEFQWVQYQLDMSATVEEIVQSLDTITIEPAIMNLHYLITDKKGDAAVIECLEEGITIYRGKDLSYPVLSNNPYQQALRYLGFFKGYGGEMDVQHRSGSQERFVSAVHLLHSMTPNSDPVAYAQMILNTVRQEDTRWQFVYDISGQKIWYKTYDSIGESDIGFEELKKIKHNKFVVTLYGGKHKRIAMNAGKNRKHLNYIQDQLEEYFPGKEQVYDLMMEAGERSLQQK